MTTARLFRIPFNQTLCRRPASMRTAAASWWKEQHEKQSGGVIRAVDAQGRVLDESFDDARVKFALESITRETTITNQSRYSSTLERMRLPWPRAELVSDGPLHVNAGRSEIERTGAPQ